MIMYQYTQKYHYCSLRQVVCRTPNGRSLCASPVDLNKNLIAVYGTKPEDAQPPTVAPVFAKALQKVSRAKALGVPTVMDNKKKLLNKKQEKFSRSQKAIPARRSNNPIVDRSERFAPCGVKPVRNVHGGSSVVGFKKLMYHQVMARGYMLYPNFNRRKHNHSYAMVVNNHHVRLSKMYGYLSKNRIASYIGFALKAAWSLITVPARRAKSVRKRPIPFLVSLIESDTSLVLLRCQHQFYLRKSRQYVTHSKWKPCIQRLLPFGDTNHRHGTFFGSSIRIKHNRWHTHGSVLRTR